MLLALFLQKTRLGKCIYMSGSNINATHFSGVNTHRVLIAIYTLSSLLCVIAGLVMMARFNSARMGYGDSYLLLTVLAIILGGTDPFGGFGRVSGVVTALVVLQVIATGLNLMNVSPHFSGDVGRGADRRAGAEVFPPSLSAAAGDAPQRGRARAAAGH